MRTSREYSASALSLFSLLLSSTLYSTAQAQICYYPNGLVPTDYDYVPCTGDSTSSCCIPSEGDICLSNGLCQFGKDSTYYFRGACTDKTWAKNGGCPSYCATTNSEGWEKLVRCSNTQYCCIDAASSTGNCCDDSSNIFSVDFAAASTVNTYGSTTSASHASTGYSSPSTSTGTKNSGSATAAATATATVASVSTTSASAASASPTSKSHTGIYIGAGVGGALVLGVIAGIVAVCFCCRSRKPKVLPPQQAPLVAPPSYMSPQPTGAWQNPQPSGSTGGWSNPNTTGSSGQWTQQDAMAEMPTTSETKNWNHGSNTHAYEVAG
ncbi:MAG: hypothetical protein M1824_005212 [Vezdaea acicularis]|nr:MAG: hypothetical protein M1824_005212 [Vezdaea acicularis]